MPTVLTRYVTHNYIKARRQAPAMPEISTGTLSELSPLIEILKSSAGLDFSDYKTRYPATPDRAAHGVERRRPLGKASHCSAAAPPRRTLWPRIC